MTRRKSRRHVLRTAGITVAGLAGCLGIAGGPPPEEQARQHRESLSKYTDVAVAKADGYQMTTPYVRTDEGVLGLPFVNRGAPELDPEQPTVLFYDLREDGGLALLGAEWLVPADSRDAPPSMFGKEFHDATPGETAFIPEHYGLHVWLFEENPAGLFATYHTGVEPPSFIGQLETAWEALTPYYSGASATETGYTNTEQCIAVEEGGYGVPFVDTDLTGTDLESPAVLLYRLTSSWTYNLLGAEWYVPADAVDAPPSMFGTEFHGPMAGHSPESDQPEHYGLHVWLFGANPEGLFEPFNPTVEC